MAPLRDAKKSAASASPPADTTPSLRPRKAIVIYNERQIQARANDERRQQQQLLHSSGAANHHSSSSNGGGLLGGRDDERAHSPSSAASNEENNDDNNGAGSPTAADAPAADENRKVSATRKRRSADVNEAELKSAKRGKVKVAIKLEPDEDAEEASRSSSDSPNPVRRSARKNGANAAATAAVTPKSVAAPKAATRAVVKCEALNGGDEETSKNNAKSTNAVINNNGNGNNKHTVATAPPPPTKETTTTSALEQKIIRDYLKPLTPNSNNPNSNSTTKLDKFDQTMESVLQNISTRHFVALQERIQSANNSFTSSAASPTTTYSTTASPAPKPYVYRPRNQRGSDSLVTAIYRNLTQDETRPFPTSLPRSRYAYSGGGGAGYATSAYTSGDMTAGYASPQQFNASSTNAASSTSGGALCATYASTSSSSAAMFAPSETPVVVPSTPTSVESSLARLFGSGATAATRFDDAPVGGSHSPSPADFSSAVTTATTEGRNIVPNFTTNPLLAATIPAKLEFNDVYRPFTARPPPHVASRATVDVRMLGKALFHDDPAWSRYTFPKRSLFGTECLVYFYRSLRWPDRKLVLVPFGKGVVAGDIPYTCGSCFQFSTCLKHRFDLQQRNKIPVIVARRGQLLDDPDQPRVPHICDPSQLTDAERAALADYGELMAGTRVEQAPKSDDGAISPEVERRNLLIIVARLTEYCVKLLSVGLDFTRDSMREKAFDIADEINLPRHCLTDEWLTCVGQWLGVPDAAADGCALTTATHSGGAALREDVAAVIFGGGLSDVMGLNPYAGGSGIIRHAAGDGALNAPGDAVGGGGIGNINDYLQSMVSEAMFREDSFNHVNGGDCVDDVEMAIAHNESIENGAECGTSNAQNDGGEGYSGGFSEGIRVLVKESCPIEFVLAPDEMAAQNGMLPILRDETPGAVDMSLDTFQRNDFCLMDNAQIKLELDALMTQNEPTASYSASSGAGASPIDFGASTAAETSIQKRAGSVSSAPESGASATRVAPKAASVNGDLSDASAGRRTRNNSGNSAHARRMSTSAAISPIFTVASSSGAAPESTAAKSAVITDKKTLYAVIQESFTKTNFPEVANALDLIKAHILQRDCSLMPMFNNFSTRIAKMMYTTKSRASTPTAPMSVAATSSSFTAVTSATSSLTTTVSAAGGCANDGQGACSNGVDGRPSSSAVATTSVAEDAAGAADAILHPCQRIRRQPNADEISAAFDNIKQQLINSSASAPGSTVFGEENNGGGSSRESNGGGSSSSARDEDSNGLDLPQ